MAVVQGLWLSLPPPLLLLQLPLPPPSGRQLQGRREQRP